MKKIICEGDECKEGICPLHGAPWIILQDYMLIRLPYEEIDQEFDVFETWMKTEAFRLWQMRYWDKRGKEKFNEMIKKYKEIKS